jgi:hypothetical protein
MAAAVVTVVVVTVVVISAPYAEVRRFEAATRMTRQVWTFSGRMWDGIDMVII